MTEKYDIVSQGRSAAYLYMSPQPASSRKVATIVKIVRTGEWEKNTLEIDLSNHQTGFLPENTSDAEIVDLMLGWAGIDARTCAVNPVQFVQTV